jgi:hypothetical protein
MLEYVCVLSHTCVITGGYSRSTTVIGNCMLNLQTCARKWTEHPQDFHIYLRDRRITGSEYKPKVLPVFIILDLC